MKNLCLILLIICGLTSCTTPKYFVASDADLLQIDWDRNMLNYIPLMESDIASSEILYKTYTLLNQQSYSKLNKYLSSLETDSPDYYLAKTFYHISKCEYEKGLSYLSELNYSFCPLEELLFIDLNYEIAKKNKAQDYKKILRNYQSLIDSYPSNELLKKIVSLRVRYARYRY